MIRRRNWTRVQQRVVNNFEKTHVIMMMGEPNHRIWNLQERYQYLRSQGLSPRRVNTLISVDYGTELLDDFNPCRNNQIHYVDAVRRIDSKWLHVHFERYNLQWYDVGGAYRERLFPLYFVVTFMMVNSPKDQVFCDIYISK
ncbi:unnamed protein product [Allacma fusca]|uniref:Uncharacterized protein n=1 Tax=Allacma fusca TaxID=39272 RepID=A0A8J2PZS8_9HEXA|nr:unnamed protein product [Allacma fusca]